MAQGRVDQAAYDLALRNHDDRLRALEASTGAEEGIRFDFDNEGDWFSIHTTGFGGPSNIGIDLTSAEGGIIITSHSGSAGGFFEVFVDGDDNGGITLSVEDDDNDGIELITRGTDNGGITINTNDGDNGIFIKTNSSDSGGITIQNSGSGNLELRNSDGILFILDDSTASGINIVSSSNTSMFMIQNSGAANIFVGSTVADPILSAPVTTGVVIVADDNGGQAAIQMGMNGSDFFTVFDRESNSPTSIVERFRFFANGQMQAFNLPTSPVGLASGSVWVGVPGTTVLNLVP